MCVVSEEVQCGNGHAAPEPVFSKQVVHQVAVGQKKLLRYSVPPAPCDLVYRLEVDGKL